MSRAPIQFRREKQAQYLKKLFFLKNSPMHFLINSIRVYSPVKRNELSFSSIEISKQLSDQVHSVSKVRLKFIQAHKPAGCVALIYLPFGCPAVNSGPLPRAQPHLVDLNPAFCQCLTRRPPGALLRGWIL